jgi:hypothetical protein
MPIYGRILYNKKNDPYGLWQSNPLSPVNLPPVTSLISNNKEPYSTLKSRFTDMYPMNEQSLPIQVGTVFRCNPDNLLHRGFIPCMIMQKDGLKRLTIMLQLILQFWILFLYCRRVQIPVHRDQTVVLQDNLLSYL